MDQYHTIAGLGSPGSAGQLPLGIPKRQERRTGTGPSFWLWRHQYNIFIK